MGSLWTGSCGYTVNAGPKLAEGGHQIINYSAPADRDNHLLSAGRANKISCFIWSFILVESECSIHEYMTRSDHRVYKWALTYAKHYCFISYWRMRHEEKRWQWLRNSVFTSELHSEQRLTGIIWTVHSIYTTPHPCMWKSDIKVGLYNTFLHQKSPALQLHEGFEYKCYKVQREHSWSLRCVIDPIIS